MNKALIIIPAYNEELNIGNLISSIDSIMKDGTVPYELVIVNDGSTDQTADVIHSLAKDYPINVITHETNKGIGRVFLSGITKAADIADSQDVIIIIEADCTNQPSVIPDMIQKINEGYDLVIGSRYCREGRYANFPLSRYVLSIGANSLLKLFFYIKGVRDYTIFFRAYKADTLKRALLEYKNDFIYTNTFVANAEILIKLSRVGVRAAEVPLIYNYGLKKGKSGMKVIKTLKEYCVFIFKELTSSRSVKC